MNDANFFGGASTPDPNANPADFARAKAMAQMLMKQGASAPQGQMAGGQFVAPSPLEYANQIGSAALGGQQMQKLGEAQRASTILNGGAVMPRAAGFLGVR